MKTIAAPLSMMALASARRSSSVILRKRDGREPAMINPAMRVPSLRDKATSVSDVLPKR